MKWCRAVGCSDWHLGKLSNHFTDHLQRQLQEIRKPYLWAARNGVKTMLMPGDAIDDSTIDGPILEVLLDVLSEFDGKVHTHMLLGNHDVANIEEHSLRPLETLIRRKKLKSCTVYSSPTHVEIDGIHFNMLPFPYNGKNKVYHDEPTVNLAHLEWRGSVGDNGKTKFVDGYTDGDKGKDVWIMGHLHTPQYLVKPRVLYLGAPYQTNFGETPEKYFWDLRFCYRNDRLVFKHERIPQRQGFVFENFVVTKLSDLKGLKKDTSHLYKLKVEQGLKLPPDLFVQYPNIYDHNVRPIESKELQETLDEQGQEFSIRRGLEEQLTKLGLTPKEIKRADWLLTTKIGI